MTPHSVKLLNDNAREILHSDVNTIGTAFKGQGQTACVADTGSDPGNVANVPAPFSNRLITLFPVGRNGVTDEPHGHGTHVCGSVVGDGTLNNGTRMEAAASRADLIVQSLLTSNGELMTGLLKDLLSTAYNQGARIHTNSWGAYYPSIPYNENAASRELDDFVFANKDLVVCFAAGNDGIDRTANPGSMSPDRPDGIVDLGQVGSEAIAKNIITVGACESERTSVPWDQSTWAAFASKLPATPLRTQHFADNREEVAAFSSRVQGSKEECAGQCH
jgi:subtilisin family serine protease